MKLELENRCLLVFLSCLLSQICAQLCRTPCSCPWIPPRCHAGVSLIIDGCGCCRICARQLGESCNHIYVCDQTKELHCDYSTSANEREGTCNYNHDGRCETDGRVYEDGETFQPSCKFQCKCIDGGVTCTPLCSEDVLLPNSECPSPRRIQIPGKCCQEWICDGQQSRISNELERGPKLLEESSHIRSFPCTEWSTEWSACSTSCGMGVSLRVSNKNEYCRLETQSRLCMVRPCRHILGITNRGGTACKPNVFSPHQIRFEIQDCISTKMYTPMFCGVCGMRHCVPYHTADEMIDFQCRGGITKNLMMFIISCVCY
ncbi:CCN family member 5-like [Discoglossus pictus]